MFAVALVGADGARMRHDLSEARVQVLIRRLIAQKRGREVGMVGPLGLAGEGVTLATHARNHQILSHIDAEAIDTEIRSSMEIPNREVGLTLPVFAHATGEHSPASVPVLRRLGIRAGFTTERGIDDLRHADWFRLPRNSVAARSTLAIVRTLLLSPPCWLSSRGH